MSVSFSPLEASFMQPKLGLLVPQNLCSNSLQREGLALALPNLNEKSENHDSSVGGIYHLCGLKYHIIKNHSLHPEPDWSGRKNFLEGREYTQKKGQLCSIRKVTP